VSFCVPAARWQSAGRVEPVRVGIHGVRAVPGMVDDLIEHDVQAQPVRVRGQVPEVLQGAQVRVDAAEVLRPVPVIGGHAVHVRHLPGDGRDPHGGRAEVLHVLQVGVQAAQVPAVPGLRVPGVCATVVAGVAVHVAVRHDLVDDLAFPVGRGGRGVLREAEAAQEERHGEGSVHAVSMRQTLPEDAVRGA